MSIFQSRLLRRSLLVIALPTLYGIFLRFTSREDLGWMYLLETMSVSFLLLVPMVMGILTTYFSADEKLESNVYCCFIPWVPVLALLLITMLLSMEGWACWLMALPFFLLMSSIGGFIGRQIKRQRNSGRVSISFALLLPFLASPVEHWIGAIPGTYTADTHIDIHAPAAVIWNNVTRVRAIPAQQDKGYLTRFLGFPRPVRAELNYAGVGGYREAVFTNGLVFHETVLAYEEQKKMTFSIKAYPYEIPSTTMDQHIVIGGNYFDVLDGTYELEPLGNGTFRLHLYSHFKLKTTFNFYAGLWGKWIMKDIQQNILQVEKVRAETGS